MPNPMTVPEYVAHARKLREATTRDGEWLYNPTFGISQKGGLAIVTRAINTTFARDDATFIVEAHNDLVPRLCAVVEAQREALQKYGRHEDSCTVVGRWTEGYEEACECGLSIILAQPIDAFMKENGHG